MISPGQRDAILGLDKVLAEFGEDLLSLELRILFGHRDQHRRYCERPSAGRLRTERSDQRLHRCLMDAEALHAGDQRRNQVSPTLQLDIDQ